MSENLYFPEWTDEERARAVAAAIARPAGVSINQLSRELAPLMGRTPFAIRGKLHKLLMSPERREQWRQTENRRYRSRVPAYRSKTELEIMASRPPISVLEEHDTRCRAPVRDLTAKFCGDPPVGYSALERPA